MVLPLIVTICYSKDMPMQLTIKPNRVLYEAGEDIVVTANLENKSDKEMIVFWDNQRVMLVSEKVGIVTAEMPRTKIPVNIETLYIKRNKSIAKTVIIANNLNPRQYKLSVHYNFPNIDLDFKTGPSQEIIMGDLFSNTITIKVVKKRIKINQ